MQDLQGKQTDIGYLLRLVILMEIRTRLINRSEKIKLKINQVNSVIVYVTCVGVASTAKIQTRMVSGNFMLFAELLNPWTLTQRTC